MEPKPFWKTKKLEEMSLEEWESLCDGCGLCCLVKLEDADTGELLYTKQVCELMDCHTCRCTDYKNRHKTVHDCLPLTPENIDKIEWLPASCAYKLIHNGQSLHPWHPLISKDPQSAILAGKSIKDWTINEKESDQDRLLDYIIEKPFD